ncbi:MAG: flagellar basal body rod protein FlgB [Lachnobacterium sp.]|nr:flagellar basal body rod protein FlgB [Lachnobacterium sp.]MCI7087707.1 flagellar basal body rod protein FlgB [Lachnobacterium sp.]MCI7532842.1 flagellar basal body rod protein FlgB [Lachnobacterium sp.]MDD7712651.1 flagellar basal body rod protein FlgB [Lachnobacterium sp.]MDY5460587.1 flagellar basal body rod protein FlgB [Agathobacter sp.]
MLSTNAFDYVNVLDKAADASWKRETVLANNIANVDTPGYKRKDLDFEGVLKQELGRCKHTSLDTKIENLHMDHLNPSVYTDLSNYSYRLDGNNVDIDNEEVEYASEQLRYEGITAGINNEFNRMKSVIS